MQEALEQALLVATRRSSAPAGAGTPAAPSPSSASARARKLPPPIQRMRADDLLAAVFPRQVGCQENVTGAIECPTTR